MSIVIYDNKADNSLCYYYDSPDSPNNDQTGLTGRPSIAVAFTGERNLAFPKVELPRKWKQLVQEYKNRVPFYPLY